MQASGLRRIPWSSVGPLRHIGDAMDVLIRLIALVAVIGAIAVAAAYLYDRLFGRVTIHEYERGLRYDAGRFVGLVGPGVIRYPRWSSEIEVVDTRPVAITVDGQE